METSGDTMMVMIQTWMLKDETSTYERLPRSHVIHNFISSVLEAKFGLACAVHMPNSLVVVARYHRLLNLKLFFFGVTYFPSHFVSHPM